jgi:capsular polysaccharide transport system permease protein
MKTSFPHAARPIQAAPLPQTLKPPRFRSLRTITALILREMESTYGRSPGGYVWAVLQPVGMIVLLSLAFSLLVHKPALGTSFMFFYATGYLPFDMYASLASKITSALIYSRPLLAYPRVTWVDTIIARLILNTLTLITVFAVVISGIMLLNDTHARFDIFSVMVGLGMAVTLGLGVGLMNCLLTGLFPVWTIIWGILSRPLFLASGVLFLLEGMPRHVQNVLWWNPLVHVTALVRKGFYPTYDGSFISVTYGYGFGLILIAVGLIFLRAHYKTVLQQ